MDPIIWEQAKVDNPDPEKYAAEEHLSDFKYIAIGIMWWGVGTVRDWWMFEIFTFWLASLLVPTK